MNNLATTPPRLKRKYGFSGRSTLDNVPAAFLVFLILGIVVGVALWCALSDDSLPDPVPTPTASTLDK